MWMTVRHPTFLLQLAFDLALDQRSDWPRYATMMFGALITGGKPNLLFQWLALLTYGHSFVTDPGIPCGLHHNLVRPHRPVFSSRHQFLVSHVRSVSLRSGHRLLLFGLCFDKSFFRKL